MRTQPTARGGGVSCAVLLSIATAAHAGVLDTPLPTFSNGHAAQRIAVIPAAVRNNNLDTAVVCTNLGTGKIDIGLEVFNNAGVRGNSINLDNGSLLGVNIGETVTIATNDTALLHEDRIVVLEAPVTNLRNGSVRVIASDPAVGCVGLRVDLKHTISDPAVCPTCIPPPLTIAEFAPTTGGGATTTTTTTLASTTTTTLLTLCQAAPQVGCRKPTFTGKSSISFKDVASDASDTVGWKWGAGAATSLADYGNPVTSTQYAICVYDRTANVAALVFAANVSPGGLCGTKPCWSAYGGGLGYKYSTRTANADGLVKVDLKVGAQGLAKISVKGKGVPLVLPSLPLAKAPSVTVQLRNTTNAICWDADYSISTANSTTQFKAKSD